MKWIGSLLLLLTLSFTGFAQRHELGLLTEGLSLKHAPELALMYRLHLSQEWNVRAYASFGADTDREIRSDSISLHKGTVNYLAAVGVQRMLVHDKTSRWSTYAGLDLYWNSKFHREAHETYYGYYFNYGIRPYLGGSYDLMEELKLFAELRAQLDVNTQGYSAPGENYDRRLTYKSLDHLALGISYTL